MYLMLNCKAMVFEKFCPILLDLPKCIRTSRLMLRPIESDDSDMIYNAVRESLSELEPWLPWATSSFTHQQAEENSRHLHAAYVLRSSMQYLVFKDNNFVGLIGLFNINWDIPSASIELWCCSSEIKNGYLTEALQALSIFAFDVLKLKRLQFVCDAENEPAIKLAERAEYRLELVAEGLLKKPNRDELRQCHQYSRYNSSHPLHPLKIQYVYP